MASAVASPTAKTIQHYRRPPERPFAEEERDKITILVGGLTRKHEELIQAVFQGSGYRCELLPIPDQSAFLLGKEFGNNGQCSPCYFTSGALIKYLRSLEASGMSRQEIVDGYLYFTAGSCGPCRFSTYAAEYRMALQSAGFDGFRVLRFQQDDGINQKAEAPGLKYTIDFGLGMLKVLFIGDVLNDMTHDIRAYEVNPGDTDRVMAECMKDFCDHLREYKAPELVDASPRIFKPIIRKWDMLRLIASVFYKMHMHLKGKEFQGVLARCRRRINAIPLDRTKLKPIVKVVGEFWAQTTEGGGNYRMFDFLEKEGAHVQPEAIGTWLAYLLAHARMQLYPKRGMNAACEEPGRWAVGQKLRNELDFQKRRIVLSFGEWFYAKLYHRIGREMGGVAHQLVPQEELSEYARPFFTPLARGGEGYLEVGKNIYYHSKKLTHMVLGLKPFGCLPSSQSDGIQSAVVGKHRDMIYLPIETSGEGEVNAHSRVQMALGEAKAKAKAELKDALASTGKTPEQVRDFVTRHPELNRPLYKVPRHPGTAGVAANFVFHVSDLMAEQHSEG